MLFASVESEAPVRVMIVDDSAVVRGLVSRWVEATPGFVVAATAANGRAALDHLDKAAPDIVLLDLDMPEVDGLCVLPLLLRRRPGLSIVIVSTLSVRNAEISLRCLELGAVECLPKPGGAANLGQSTEFRGELTACLRGLAARHRRRDALGAPPPLSRLASGASRPRAVVLGASTGGPRALAEVLGGLRAVSSKLPILIVQHMPPIFTTVLATQLTGATGIAVREACDGEPLSPGRAYLAPGGRHMGLRRGEKGPCIRLDDGPAEHHCRPALDVLLRDAAMVLRDRVVAAVLTGMGTDGLDGARALTRVGGSVIVQDRATSVVWGMPGSIAEAGLAQAVLPLGEIATTLARRAGADLDHAEHRGAA